MPTIRSLRFTAGKYFLVYAPLAVAIFTLFVVDDEVAAGLMLLLALAQPALLATGIAAADGSLRAFCIGALFPAAATFVFVLTVHDDFGFSLPKIISLATSVPNELHFYFSRMAAPLRALSIATWLLSIIVGLACVWMRWMIGSAKTEQK